MFAFNLTGEIDEMRRRHDLVLALGGTCVMANLTGVGLAGFLALARHAALPIHAHRNGWGALSRHPALGFDYVRLGQGLAPRRGRPHARQRPPQQVLRARRQRHPLRPLDARRRCSPDKPCTVMPVFSSGQSAAQVHDTYAALGSADLIYAAGGGIMAHPGGPAAGVNALRDAWDAALAGETAHARAARSPALAAALGKFA